MLAIEFIVTVWRIFCAFAESWYYFFVPRPMKSVRNEVVLITGGAKGIGRLMAIRFAELGATVIIWDMDGESLSETVRIVKSRHCVSSPGEPSPRVFGYLCDVSERANINVASERVRQEVDGAVTILINNAGTHVGKTFLETGINEIEHSINVNLMAHFWTTKHFLPDMVANNHGHIVTISSSTGLLGIRGLTDYCTAKFGLVGFTETLDYELTFGGYTGVHTTLVCPYHIDTGLFAGCKTKVPWLLPILKPEWVVDKIINAVRTNQRQLFLPKSIYWAAVMKTMLPVTTLHLVHKICGADTFMDGYGGRNNNRNNTL